MSRSTVGREVRIESYRDRGVKYHLLIYVLSVDTVHHSRYRCYQRAALSALGVVDGFLRVDEWLTLSVTYVLNNRGDSASPSSRHEMAMRKDVLLLRDAQTCLGKVIAALAHLDSKGGFDGVLFTDDDAFLHPQRLAMDMAQWSGAHYLVMGPISWGAYWHAVHHRHYGYGNLPREVAGKLVDEWHRAAGSPRQGPYPFPNGFHMGLSRRTVTALVGTLATSPSLQKLQTYLKKKRATPKCDPEPDAGLGYLLAQLPASTPLTTVDLTSAARIHFWRTRGTQDALHHGLSMLHGAKNWTEHFAWAACALSALPTSANLSSRGHVCYQGYPPLKRACANARGGCPAHYEPITSEHRTWCSASEDLRHGRWRPAGVTVAKAICNETPPLECASRVAAAGFRGHQQRP